MAAKKQIVESHHERIECAYAGCPYDAIVNHKTPTGWAKVCRNHYEAFYLNKAEETCKKLGLDTVEKKRAWVRVAMKKLSRKFTPTYQREPGEDTPEEIGEAA